MIVIPVLFLFSAAYMVTPSEQAFFHFTHFETQQYLPSTMQHNTIPPYQCPHAVLACAWLNFNMTPDPCLVVHKSLCGWAKLYILLRPAIIHFNPFLIYNFDTHPYVDIALAMTKTAGHNTTYILTIHPLINFYTAILS
ncbi:MAG: hypothetical protein ACUVXA_15275 [Candidatus Jordarchaeum sp.]|uniref:hypothetical protein n=1 Tax=Candidatus Jordarchaeum sp. TaxID=2823881 RepID=UPI004049FEFB